MYTLKEAVILAVLGFVFMIKNPFHKRGFLRAQGIITDYEKRILEGKTLYFAKVKFPFKTEEILFTDKYPRAKKPRFNKIVSVLYNCQNPLEAQIEPAISILLPWLFLFAAFCFLIYSLKQNFSF